ncbi:MAG: substrate-binding domain-containing protein [Methanosarcinales archaeon Met12]|nr:MAG: substrate-binding domain-containing protein [Methanosarcinales archaeon Met12]
MRNTIEKIGAGIKNLFNGLIEDTQAVSPVMATLVLIVVAITGAAAVGTMTGAFSDDVGRQIDAGDAAIPAGRLIIAGSTTVQPVTERLAEAFMRENPGVRATVQGGGSGAGITSTAMDVVDIGGVSRNVTPAELARHPNLRTVQIGRSIVVVIAGSGINLTDLNNITIADLRDLYQNGTIRLNSTVPAGITAATTFRRADTSGTEDSFAAMLGIRADQINGTISGRTGNAGVLAAVQATPISIGFVDIGFAEGAPIRTITISTNATLRADRPLNLLTNGAPSALEQAFIDFARLPGSIQHFRDVGMRSMFCR